MFSLLDFRWIIVIVIALLAFAASSGEYKEPWPLTGEPREACVRYYRTNVLCQSRAIADLKRAACKERDGSARQLKLFGIDPKKCLRPITPTRGEACSIDEYWRYCAERLSPSDKRPVACFAMITNDTEDLYGTKRYKGETFIATMPWDDMVSSREPGIEGVPLKDVSFLTACSEASSGGLLPLREDWDWKKLLGLHRKSKVLCADAARAAAGISGETADAERFYRSNCQ